MAQTRTAQILVVLSRKCFAPLRSRKSVRVQYYTESRLLASIPWIALPKGEPEVEGGPVQGEAAVSPRDANEWDACPCRDKESGNPSRGVVSPSLQDSMWSAVRKEEGGAKGVQYCN